MIELCSIKGMFILPHLARKYWYLNWEQFRHEDVVLYHLNKCRYNESLWNLKTSSQFFPSINDIINMC